MHSLIVSMRVRLLLRARGCPPSVEVLDRVVVSRLLTRFACLVVFVVSPSAKLSASSSLRNPHAMRSLGTQTLGTSFPVWWLERGVGGEEEIASEIARTEALPDATHAPTASMRPSWVPMTRRS